MVQITELEKSTADLRAAAAPGAENAAQEGGEVQGLEQREIREDEEEDEEEDGGEDEEEEEDSHSHSHSHSHGNAHDDHDDHVHDHDHDHHHHDHHHHHEQEDEDDDEDDEDEEDDDFDDEEAIANETLLDRLVALQDIVPINRRRQISNAVESLYGAAMKMKYYAGAATWILSTTTLLVLIPLGMEIEKEQMLVAMENEQKIQQQAQQMLTPAPPQRR